MKALTMTPEEIRAAADRRVREKTPPPPEGFATWNAAVRALLVTGPKTRREMREALGCPDWVIGTAITSLHLAKEIEQTRNQGRRGPKYVNLYRLRP